MTPEQLETYTSAINEIRGVQGKLPLTDKQAIEKGNEMLARAGLPPLTPEQAAKFLANREGRAKDRREGLLLLGGTFTLGYLIALLTRKRK